MRRGRAPDQVSAERPTRIAPTRITLRGAEVVGPGLHADHRREALHVSSQLLPARSRSSGATPYQPGPRLPPPATHALAATDSRPPGLPSRARARAPQLSRAQESNSFSVGPRLTHHVVQVGEEPVCRLAVLGRVGHHAQPQQLLLNVLKLGVAAHQPCGTRRAGMGRSGRPRGQQRGAVVRRRGGKSGGSRVGGASSALEVFGGVALAHVGSSPCRAA